MLSNRLSQLSCNQEEFEKAARDYQEAMLKSGFAGELEYVKTNGSAKRSRKRNIVWFNPPYSDHVKTNIGKEFLKLVALHFPHHHWLHKICNNNNIKVSYCCMPNMAAIISKHNKIALQNRADPAVPHHRVCLFVLFILLTRGTTSDIKQRVIVTQTHFRRYTQYHVRLFFICFLIFFLQ